MLKGRDGSRTRVRVSDCEGIHAKNKKHSRSAARVVWKLREADRAGDKTGWVNTSGQDIEKARLDEILPGRDSVGPGSHSSSRAEISVDL